MTTPAQAVKTKDMKTAFTILVFMGSLAQAEETLLEKADATAKSVAREIKKGANRAKEAACGKLTGDSQAACLAKKAKNRASETVEAVSDKATEIKNSAD